MNEIDTNQENITNEMPIESKKKECNDIGEKKWTRKCPRCKKELIYNYKTNFQAAERFNSMCSSCSKIKYKNIKMSNSGKYIKFCPLCNGKIFYKNYMCCRMSIKNNDSCRSCSKLGQKNAMAGKFGDLNVSRRPEVRKKIRDSKITRIKSLYGPIIPNYNPKACRIFDEINKHFQWLGQHAENGGEYNIEELGFFVDFYEPILNIVIEYDERYHNKSNIKVKDNARQEKIEQCLKCKFYRIKDGQDWREVLK